MKSRLPLTTLALALVGAGMWFGTGHALQGNGHFENQPNPFGIKRSPYGQVLAMAIQTPIDGDWHGGLEIHDHAPGESCDSCDSTPAEATQPDCGHDHGDGSSCGHDHSADTAPDQGSEAGESPAEPAPKPTPSLLVRLDQAATQRTNPNPPTAGHQLYLRREVEKKLRFAYELDPSHYANYNSYNLFITQSSLGTGNLTQEQATELVFQLADQTIGYCLQESVDPRPALTAASAAYNKIERMLLADPDAWTTEELRQQLGLMDHCIQRHFQLLEASTENGQWELLSSRRQQDVLTRSQFTMKLRESADVAIQRRENHPPFILQGS